MNSSITHALSEALGPDFTEQQVAALTSLEVLRADDLDGLEICTGLTSLTLFGLEATSLESLRGMSKLAMLRIGCAPIADLSPLAGLPLRTLTLNFTAARDARPILAINNLKNAELLGNPWSEAEHARLAKAQHIVSPEPHRALTCRLADRGFQLAYGNRPGSRPALVVCATGTQYVGDYSEVTEAQVKDALDKAGDGLDTYDFLEQFPLAKPEEAPLIHLIGRPSG